MGLAGVHGGCYELFGGAHVHSITVKVADLSRIAETEQALMKLLRERHRQRAELEATCARGQRE